MQCSLEGRRAFVTGFVRMAVEGQPTPIWSVKWHRFAPVAAGFGLRLHN